MTTVSNRACQLLYH